MSDVRFTNISATAESGIVVAGCAQSTIDGLVLDGVRLRLEQSTQLPGGFLDYRPGARDVVDDVSTSALFVEFANHVDLKDVEARTAHPSNNFTTCSACVSSARCAHVVPPLRNTREPHAAVAGVTVHALQQCVCTKKVRGWLPEPGR